MGSCYEFAFACTLKPDLSQEVIDTLKYMTRSEEYKFETTLKDDLFDTSWEEGILGGIPNVSEVNSEAEDEFSFLYGWRSIISNNANYGDEFLSGLCGSVFKDSKLNVRRYINEDDFFMYFPLLMEWLVSICEPLGFIGYYSCIRTHIGGDPTLIYFENGQVLEKKVTGEFQELLTSD